MVSIVTDFPVAFDSRDHTHPWGTKRDNYTSPDLLDEMRRRFGTYSLLDLGCAGGRFVVDAAARGNRAIGLEGSDWSLKHNRPHWPTHAGRNLFTCDISRPFRVRKNSRDLRFDVVTAWEVLEHIPEDRLPVLVQNIAKHLRPNGVFWCSINSYLHEVSSGIELHVSAHLSKQRWRSILGASLRVTDYPYPYSVRDDSRKTSLYLECSLP